MHNLLNFILLGVLVTCLLAMGYIAGDTGNYLKGYADGRAQAHQDISDYCEYRREQ